MRRCHVMRISPDSRTLYIIGIESLTKVNYRADCFLIYWASKMALDFLFGKRKTPEEMLKQNQRALTRAVR